MAVQAQYPSNVLLLNRNVPEGKNNLGNDYSLQPQEGVTTASSSRFLDHHHQSPNHILFNNLPGGSGGFNSRKRLREVKMNQFMSSLHQQQSHSNQLVDAAVSTSLRLDFDDQQQQLQQHSFSPVLSLLSQDLSTQINQQRDEIEHFLHTQGEDLRRVLAEKRQRHYYALVRAAEESVARRMRDKEAEAEKAARRHAELAARAAHFSTEAQVWQARARAQEAEAAALQAQLQQAVVSGGGGGCVRDEVGGLGCPGGEAAEDAESAYIDPERVVVASGPGCKACGKRVASVVLLPCRHLCVCTECDDVVQACPLCLSFRSSSIEVYMS